MGNNYSQIPSSIQIPKTNAVKRKEDGSIDKYTEQLFHDSKRRNTNLSPIIPSGLYGVSNTKTVLVDEPDSFVNIVNSLKPDKSYKFLTFKNAQVFQFPKNRIYIRDCYYKMFENICQIISEGSYSNIVITGQPGIGKTSFIYVLLHFIKNISSFRYDALEKEYLKLIKRKNEIIKFILSSAIGINEEEYLNSINGITKDLQSLTKGIDQKEFLKFIKDEKLQTIVDNLTKCIDESMYSDLIKDEEVKKVLDKLPESHKKLCLGLIKCYKDIEKEINTIEKYLAEEIKKGNTLYNGYDSKSKGFNYFILDDIFKISNKEYKDIYICKGKRNGSVVDKKIYLLRNNILKEVKINEGDIKDSIVIVDTFNGIFGDNNIIISISSPEQKNYKSYENHCKELYFDSLSDVEIKEWYNLCINSGPYVDDRNKEFLDTCERYGNIPRLIYYHYVYKSYENRKYWDYYKQLIESVVGTDGYTDFVDKYMSRDKLRDSDLSNIILKYDLELEFDFDLQKEIYKPKEHLKFISKDVEEYIAFKFFPIKNKKEYHDMKNIYQSYGDSYMKRMAFKQIIAYELSIEQLKLLRNGRKFKDDNFRLNYDKQVSIYSAEGSNIFVYYILDESNFFDLIIDGVFIKVLLDGDRINADETKIKNSIKV